MAETSGHTGRPDVAADAQETAYRALHTERETLERDLMLARQHQQYGADQADIEAARRREAVLLQDLDRVLTLIRAAEIRRRPGPAAQRWR